MKNKQSIDQDEKKNASRFSGFLGFAIFVFLALLVSLVVIYLRSSA